MSYYDTGLGSLDSGTSFPAGSEFGVGYTVAGLASAAAAPGAVQILRDSIAYGFRGQLVAAQWGPAFGVPSGVLAAKIRTGVALTGAQLNTIFSDVGGTFQARLRAAGSPSAVVRNSQLHQLGASSGGGTPVTSSSDPVSALLTTFGLPGSTPATPTPGTYDTMIPPSEESFFSQTVAGIPMWGVLLGGTVLAGAAVWAMMPAKKVAANRRRRSR